jgi:lipid-A-disaccharide synthase
MAAVSYALVSRLLRSRWVALPNILAGEALVPELLQREAHPRAIAAELLRLMQDGAHCAALAARFTQLHHGLRAGAGSGAAEAVLELLASRCGA